MTTLRTAAQQALEALEKVGLRADTRRGCDEAVGILRAALAQQDEPVAWLQPKTVDAQARPDLGYETCSRGDYGAFPVHTSPPRRTMVPLTVKEIFDAFYAVKNATPISKRHGLSVLEIARLVEKASWEKNNGQA